MAIVVEKIQDLKNVTPMMQQYLEVKSQYMDYILMYRLGDFFEMFYEDAVTASRELELTLTGRDCGEGYRAAMCGVPFHKSDIYIGRLVEKGYKVAVCEQTEDPSAAKGLVKREVVRVVTPGTVTDGAMLTESENNFLCAVYYTPTAVGVGFADISTGQIFATCIEGERIGERVINEIGVYTPRELIMNVDKNSCSHICDFVADRLSCVITDKRADLFDGESSCERARATFGDDECSKGNEISICAVGALIGYIELTQMTHTSFVKTLNILYKSSSLESSIKRKTDCRACRRNVLK